MNIVKKLGLKRLLAVMLAFLLVITSTPMFSNSVSAELNVPFKLNLEDVADAAEDGDTEVIIEAGATMNEEEPYINAKSEGDLAEDLLAIENANNNSRFFVESFYSQALHKQMTYRIYLPEGYYENNQKYPTVYMLHQENQTSEQFADDRLNELLDQYIFERLIQKMIVVMPDTSADSWFVNQEDDLWEDMIVKDLIPEVDASYNTIASPKYRGISGISMGGFGAFVLGLKHPELFSSIGSHMGALGNTVAGLNPMELIKSKTTDELNTYQYYLDGGTEDLFTHATDSTNDIHAYFRAKNVEHGYQTRPGGHSKDYYLTYLNRSFMMHNENFSKGLVSGSFTASPQAINLGDGEVIINFTTNVNRAAMANYVLTNTINANFNLIINVEVKDPFGNIVFEKNQSLGNIVRDSNDTTYSGSFPIPVESLGSYKNYNVTVNAGLLDVDYSLGQRPLIQVTPIGELPEDMQIDLLGDWLFIKDSFPQGEINGSSEGLDRSSWRTVQPGLDWWSDGFGDYSDMGSYIGASWYYKEFDVPEDFSMDDLTLLAGKIDDADQTYINGQLVGETGFKDGVYTASFWAASREYTIPSELLKPGEKNTIAVRVYNQSGGGGWYAGPVGIYSKAALQKAKELPSNVPSQEIIGAVTALVGKQYDSILRKDLQTYRQTLSNDYFENGLTKLDVVNEKLNWFKNYQSIQVSIQSPYVFERDGRYLYTANVEVRGVLEDGSEEVLQQGETAQYYHYENGLLKETGNQKLFFVNEFYSESVKETVKFRVYLPKSYVTDSDKRYPSVYLLHQFNSDSEFYEIDKVDQILDKGIADGSIDDMIVVMPDSSGMSWWVNGNGSNGKKWQDMVTKDLVKHIDKKYRTINDARYRGVSGVSMGGFGAFVIGFQYPDLFSAVASHMGALSFANSGQHPLEIVYNLPITALKRYSIYFDSGNLDGYRFDLPVNTLHKYLLESDVPHYAEIRDGAHDSAFYTASIGLSFAQLSRHFANASVQDGVMKGKLEVKNVNGTSAISYELATTDAIVTYADQIPDSPYLQNPNPELNIPIVIDVYHSGSNERLYSFKQYITSLGAETYNGEVVLPQILEQGNYTIVLKASVLNCTFELTRLSYKVGGGGSNNGNAPAPTNNDATTVTKEELQKAIENKEPLILTASSGEILTIPYEIVTQIADTVDIEHMNKLVWKVTSITGESSISAINKAESELEGQLQVAGSYIDLSLFLQMNDNTIHPVNWKLTKPLKLQLSVSENIDDELVSVYYWTADGKVRHLHGNFDQNTSTISVEVDQLGLYSVMTFKKNFNDVSSTRWAKRAIEVLISKHVIKGVSSDEFVPNREISRAEFASLVVRALNLKDSDQSQQPFTDVSEDKWYYSSVTAAYQHGIISGIKADQFAPQATITRQEMAVMIYNAYRLLEEPVAVDPIHTLDTFDDQNLISEWAKKQLQFVVQTGLMKGKSHSSIAPLDTATRAEAVQMIYNLMKK